MKPDIIPTPKEIYLDQPDLVKDILSFVETLRNVDKLKKWSSELNIVVVDDPKVKGQFAKYLTGIVRNQFEEKVVKLSPKDKKEVNATIVKVATNLIKENCKE